MALPQVDACSRMLLLLIVFGIICVLVVLCPISGTV
jgi:hypothetical protein